jgi:hypothetical protein
MVQCAAEARGVMATGGAIAVRCIMLCLLQQTFPASKLLRVEA